MGGCSSWWCAQMLTDSFRGGRGIYIWGTTTGGEVGARLWGPAMEPAVNNCQFTYPRETARRRFGIQWGGRPRNDAMTMLRS
jgi:hypothetical protein